MIPIVIVLFFGLGFIIKFLLHIQMNFVTSQALISIMMSLIVILLTNFANQFFSYMVDTIIEFHQKNNVSNLGRQPVKFFIINQIKLKRVASIIWFPGSVLMLYGIWLGDQPYNNMGLMRKVLVGPVALKKRIAYVFGP